MFLCSYISEGLLTSTRALMSPAGSGPSSPPLAPSLADVIGSLDGYATVRYISSQLFNSQKGLLDLIIFLYQSHF